MTLLNTSDYSLRQPAPRAPSATSTPHVAAHRLRMLPYCPI